MDYIEKKKVYLTQNYLTQNNKHKKLEIMYRQRTTKIKEFD